MGPLDMGHRGRAGTEQGDRDPRIAHVGKDTALATRALLTPGLAPVVAAGLGRFGEVAIRSHGRAVWRSPAANAWLYWPGRPETVERTLGTVGEIRHPILAMSTHGSLARGWLWLGSSWLLVSLLACSEPPVSEFTVCYEVRKDLPAPPERDIDLLLVIDTSSSMSDERDSLVFNLPRFVDVLENVEGGLPSMHIAVVSSDLGVGPFSVPGCSENGDQGAFQVQPHGACDPPDDAFIRDIELADGSRERNYVGELGDVLPCMAQLPADGCSLSQPLEAMRRALDGSHPEHTGFLREHAILMVVFITDQDDCSAADPALFDPDAAGLSPTIPFRCFEHGVICEPDEPSVPGPQWDCRPRPSSPYLHDVDAYVDFLHSLKAEPTRIMVSAAMGPAEPVAVASDGNGGLELVPSCSSAVGEARPGVRLQHFVEQFPQRSQTVALCEQDLSDAMLPIAQSLQVVLASPCLEGDIDLEPDTPGLQVDCAVSEVHWLPDGSQRESVVPACRATPPSGEELPCWQVREDMALCPDSETHALPVIARSPEYVSPSSQVSFRCWAGCVPGE